MEKVRDIINNIKTNATQTSVNQKDEVVFMKAMLNDKEYEVDVYNGKGKIGTLNPSKAARETLAIGLSTAAKIPMTEAEVLADNHEFGKKEAQNYIDVSKQFILGYVETGRKIKLGTRERSDVSLSMTSKTSGPSKVPDRKNGGTKVVDLPGFDKVKVSSPCPKHLKRQE